MSIVYTFMYRSDIMHSLVFCELLSSIFVCWVCPGGKVWPGRAADHSPPSSAAVMEEKSYTSTHLLGHTRPVTGSLYRYLYICMSLCGNFMKCHIIGVRGFVIKESSLSRGDNLCTYILLQ